MQRFGMTYTGEGDTAVAALGAVGLLLGVLEGEAATRGLHNTGGVGGGLVRVPAAVGKALHLQSITIGRKSGLSIRHRSSLHLDLAQGRIKNTGEGRNQRTILTDRTDGSGG